MRKVLRLEQNRKGVIFLNEYHEGSGDLFINGPLVSVGIPTYNRPDGLRRTLKSICHQTYKNLEIIVSDNCSPGSETEAVVRDFIANDSRIQYYRQKENRGITFNFSFVLEKATGEYFMWVADDDYWSSDSISIMLMRLKDSPGISVAMAACERIDEENYSYDFVHNFNSILNISQVGQYRLALDATTNFFWTYLFYGLYRIDFLKKSFYNFPSLFGADVLFVTQVLMASKMLYIDKTLYFRQVHKKGTAVQYANEEIGKVYADPLKYYKLIFAMGPYLLRSKVILQKNKLVIPLIVIYSGLFVLKSEILNILCYASGFASKIIKTSFNEWNRHYK